MRRINKHTLLCFHLPLRLRSIFRCWLNDGHFGGALERVISMPATKIDRRRNGEVEAEESVLVIRRIHVAMRLVAPEAVRETVERTHASTPCTAPRIGRCTKRSNSLPL